MQIITSLRQVIIISPMIFWDAWLILCLQGEALNSLLPFNPILKDFQTGFLKFHLPRLIHYQGTHTHCAWPITADSHGYGLVLTGVLTERADFTEKFRVFSFRNCTYNWRWSPASGINYGKNKEECGFNTILYMNLFSLPSVFFARTVRPYYPSNT